MPDEHVWSIRFHFGANNCNISSFVLDNADAMYMYVHLCICRGGGGGGTFGALDFHGRHMYAFLSRP